MLHQVQKHGKRFVRKRGTEAAIHPARRGFILIPALPTPLYITMALVALAAVSTTFLNSLRQRRKPSKSEKQRHQEPLTPSWVAVVSLWAPVVLLIFGVIWLVRYGSRLWERLKQGLDLATGRERIAWATAAQPTAP